MNKLELIKQHSEELFYEIGVKENNIPNMTAKELGEAIIKVKKSNKFSLFSIGLILFIICLYIGTFTTIPYNINSKNITLAFGLIIVNIVVSYIVFKNTISFRICVFKHDIKLYKKLKHYLDEKKENEKQHKTN